MDSNSKNIGDINVNISAGENKIKYYECDDNNCVFEILDDNITNYKEDIDDNITNYKENIDDDITNYKENIIDSKATTVENKNSILNEYESIPEEKNDFQKKDEEYSYNIRDIEEQSCGEVMVTSILDCGEHEQLEGVKINLYKINGLTPELIDSRITDKDGKVIFSKVSDGCYRIIELVDKRYFEKPKYIKWNEITIDCSNKKHKVLVVNKIKRFIKRNMQK